MSASRPSKLRHIIILNDDSIAKKFNIQTSKVTINKLRKILEVYKLSEIVDLIDIVQIRTTKIVKLLSRQEKINFIRQRLAYLDSLKERSDKDGN